ncbi:DUF6221 family protein [Angustibacter luteus]|uniref:DUF6221 family protein n=1 Tax=Angustibacter luteus TaxID=658456 RepID=A0ABW1JAI1_9ACTN
MSGTEVPDDPRGDLVAFIRSAIADAVRIADQLGGEAGRAGDAEQFVGQELPFLSSVMAGSRAVTATMFGDAPAGSAQPTWQDVRDRILQLARAHGALLDLHPHRRAPDDGGPSSVTWVCQLCAPTGTRPWCDTVRALGLAYSSNPDYRPEWGF